MVLRHRVVGSLCWHAPLLYSSDILSKVNDGLYRELVPLIDAVALSVEYMDQHLEKVG